MITSMSSCLIDTFCKIPPPSRISPEEVRKVLSVWTNGSSAKWYNAHSPKMMLALIVGLYRVSTGVPLMVQGIVEVGEPIWRISGDNSSYLDHLLFIMAVNFLTFSLWKAASIGFCDSNENQLFPLEEIIWDVFKIFKKIILELERELQRLNIFFLRNLCFGRRFYGWI